MGIYIACVHRVVYPKSPYTTATSYGLSVQKGSHQSPSHSVPSQAEPFMIGVRHKVQENRRPGGVLAGMPGFPTKIGPQRAAPMPLTGGGR